MLERDLGYKVEIAVLNCADYGVPQLRERAIFIASSVGPASLPPKTHRNPKDEKLSSATLEPWVTVEDAIRDLPPPPMNIDSLGGGPLSLYEDTPSDYARSMRSFEAFPFNHITRTYNQRVLNIIKEMRPGQTWDAESARMRAKYDRAITRKCTAENIPRALARNQLKASGVINPVFYRSYYWSAYTRLAWDSPALTITANANFLGSGRFSHPTELRGITMREAARLQSFDDDFRFITSFADNNDTARIGLGMDMIGEAVPPNLSQAIAMHVAAELDARTSVSAAKARVQSPVA